MEKIYTITTSNGIYKINFLDSDQFVDEIERKTGILAIDQMYYRSGSRIFHIGEAVKFLNGFQIIGKRQSSAKYFIITPQNTIKVYLTKFMLKTVNDLLSAFTTICREKNCIYPPDEYAFEYNNQTLNLSHPLSEIPPESDIKLVKKSIYPPLNLLSLKIMKMNQRHSQFSIYSNETVKALKVLENLESKIPISEFKLIFSKRELEDEKSLDSYKIANKSEIRFLFKGKGGSADLLFDFFDVNSAQTINFSKRAPKWRYVSPGFSWKGLCNQKECEAYNQEVISNLGFGIIKVKIQKKLSECPLCKKKLFSLSGCGFFSCKFFFEGYNEDNEHIKAKGIAGKENYTAFWENSGKKWKWLDIEIVELEEEIETCDEESECNEVIIKPSNNRVG